MRTSQRGVDLIKQFEGFSSKAIKLTGEQYYTIGFGHYGPDVRQGQTITMAEAEALLRRDLIQFENWVTQYTPFTMNQNQYDALVSFCYNCGPGNLQTLVRGRTPEKVADRMMVYTHSGSEAYTAGLYNRRKKERALFLEPVEEDDEMERWNSIEDVPKGYYRDQVARLVQNGYIAGTESGLNITEDQLRVILINERIVDRKIEQIEAAIAQIRQTIQSLQDLVSALGGLK